MLHKTIASAQKGDRDAMLSLLNTFSPLIKKYSYLCHFEDSKQDFTLFFIETIYKVPQKILRPNLDGQIVKYLSTALKNHYIFLCKRKSHLTAIVSIPFDVNTLTNEATFMVPAVENEYNHFFSSIKDFLTPLEYKIIIGIYYYQLSSAQIAQKSQISRQAVNQTKLRALQKLKAALFSKSSE